MFSLSYCCVLIEKEKISFLSLIKTIEFAAVIGDDNLIVL